jgi:hypothetical protein
MVQGKPASFTFILKVLYTNAIISAYSIILVMGVAPECPLFVSTLNKGEAPASSSFAANLKA